MASSLISCRASGGWNPILYNHGLVNDAKELDAKIKCNTFHRGRWWFENDDGDGDDYDNVYGTSAYLPFFACAQLHALDTSLICTFLHVNSFTMWLWSTFDYILSVILLLITFRAHFCSPQFSPDILCFFSSFFLLLLFLTL